VERSDAPGLLRREIRTRVRFIPEDVNGPQSGSSSECLAELPVLDPPLGPGAAPAARPAAFTEAYLSLVAAQLDLVLLSETSTPGARFRTGAFAFWRQHCRYLLSGAGTPQADLRADLLLAGLTAEQVRHWLDDERRDLATLAAGLAAAALALARPAR